MSVTEEREREERSSFPLFDAGRFEGRTWGDALARTSVTFRKAYHKTLGFTHKWASVQVRYSLYWCWFLFFFGSLVDVVTRQTKQLPPKSLQIKGAFCARWKKRQTIKVINQKCLGNSCSMAQQLCDGVSLSFAKLPACCEDSEQCNQV